MTPTKLFTSVLLAILAAAAILAVFSNLSQFTEDSEWIDTLAARHNLSTVEVVALQREGRLPRHRP